MFHSLYRADVYLADETPHFLLCFDLDVVSPERLGVRRCDVSGSK